MAMDAYGDTSLNSATRLDSLLTACVDAGLAGVVFVVPFILGGRIALGHLVLVALATWVAVCWCLRQCIAPRAQWVRSPAEPLLLLALLLVGLQLVPLPPALLGRLSPKIYETLPLWAESAAGSALLGTWNTLSLTPAATRSALVLLLASGLLFLTTVQRVREVEDVERLLRWIAISAFAMATFALVQYLTSNGKYFWFYEQPFSNTTSNVVGSFTNRNHFAQFVVLGIGPLVWWLQSSLRGRRGEGSLGRQWVGQDAGGHDFKAAMAVVALGVVVFAALMSTSRGGALALSVAVAVCLLVLYRGSLVRRKTLLAVAGIGLLVGACLCVHGYERVAARLDDFTSVRELSSGERLALWRADAAGIADYPLTGTGLGSHREVCPMYLQNHTTARGTEFTHAENGYVQVALETGIPGLLLALTAIGLCVYWCCSALGRDKRDGRSTRILLCIAAIAASLAANFAHSMTDFIWYVPGCMVIVVILAACGCRLCQIVRRRPDHPSSMLWISRTTWLAAAVALVLVGCFMVQNRLSAARAEPFWNRYVTLSRQLSSLDEQERPDTMRAMGEALSSALAREPDRSRAHARLAAIHLAAFNQPQDSAACPMDARQVRDAVLASQFESSAAMNEWLSRAFGDRRGHLDAAYQHARCAAGLCPLEGEAYVLLADLSFLAGPDAPDKAAFISQALRVRPGDGNVLLVAGREALLAGKFDEAVQYWRASAKADPIHQNRLLKMLQTQVPVDAVLDIVQPDLDGLRLMTRLYRERGRPDELLIVEGRFARACEDKARLLAGNPAARCWLGAAKAYVRLDNLPKSLRCLRSAVENDLSDYDARRALGECLLKLEVFDEAKTHLNWCLQRRPQDKYLRARLEAAIDGQLRQPRVTARPTTGES